MNLDHFSTTVDGIIAGNPRYERDAYLFIRDALEFTTKQQKKRGGTIPGAAECHVSGQQLLEGVRLYALQQFGPMVPTVFEHWRIRNCEDIGRIVFDLIEAREFGKSDHDTLEDFRKGYDFHEAFVKPFRPHAERAEGRRQKTEGKTPKGERQTKTPGAA